MSGLGPPGVQQYGTVSAGNVATWNSAGYIQDGGAGSSSVVVGTTVITSGTTTRVLYDNAGVVGEYTISGSGTVVAMATSPVFTTPTLGVAAGTSLALGGATIGTNALAVTGTVNISGAATITSYLIVTMTSGIVDSVGNSSILSKSGTVLNFGEAGTHTKINLIPPITNHGAADAASPVAQTIVFQGSRSGTDSNVGGATATIRASLGTGTGTPANLVLSGAVGATAGTGAHTASAAITVAGAVNGQVPSVILGSAAIATNATDGFLYLASGAGTPTGAPTAATGRVPIYIDTTNSQLWLYLGGAWKQPKTPAGAALVTWQ